ncbi:MAG: DUF423 domain-containing protein [Firmicutes bacterium]|nr:DUF423 domain-containing protein [Bacillota bacterium]MCL5971692.1 DUF423 domain-containing protein [Bacillota bacterium]
MNVTLLLFGGIFGFLAVGLGAFGAHGLKAKLNVEQLATFQTGVQYQMYHALGLGLVSVSSAILSQSTALTWAGWSFVVGIILFSGSLYTLALTGSKRWGLVTPLGGLFFLLGWGFFILAAWRSLIPA